MGYEYRGPLIDELPLSIRGRIKESVRISEQETSGLGIVLEDISKKLSHNKGELWKNFDGYNEVFVYDFGDLHESFFNRDGKIFKLFFCGGSMNHEREIIEKALGLEVIKRPKNNQDPVQIIIDGQLLEKIVGLGHKPNDQESLTYHANASGPYMGRKVNLI